MARATYKRKILFGLWFHRVGIYNVRDIVAIGRRHGGGTRSRELIS